MYLKYQFVNAIFAIIDVISKGEFSVKSTVNQSKEA